MKVLIAGGGIGGLTTALCALNFGHEVKVIEQAKQFGEVGAGLQVPPNAMKVFNALGIADKITENSFAPDAIEARMGTTGRTVFTIPLADHAKRAWGAPYLHLHRADYIAALRAALVERSAGSIILGAKVESYGQSSDDVHLNLTDGRDVKGDVLIGADGVHSQIRNQMLGDTPARFTGNVAWRAVVPMEALGSVAPRPTACAWFGEGRHAVSYRLRGGRLANFVGVVEQDDWRNESWQERGPKSELLADFKDWHPTITTMIEAADDTKLYRWALFDRSPLPKWTEGRVALLGDAAHPMLPFLAQGAAMAVEDAWVVSECLKAANGNVAAGLMQYQMLRQDRTAKVQAASRDNMSTFHKRGRKAQLATYGPMWMAGQIAPKLVHNRMNWLYGYDVTQNLLS
ncbi:FAD-dependent monooxygenase [Litorimonas sp. RW-G-Af-16]|uniref:FAD-dependent monooxygenase n=1 Tax=Litorimonas sp. RW-G-Af-16 TaxID=3241168 RepID=UPI00390CD3B9